MNTEIIICLISLIGTFTGSLIGAYTSSKLTNFRLEQIEKKLEKYEDFNSRLALVEEHLKGVVVQYVKDNRNNKNTN